MTKEYKIKPNSRVIKYYKAKKAGHSGAEAVKIAGYGHPKHVSRIEKTRGYQELQRRYKDVLQEEIDITEIAKEHASVIRQNEELGPKIAAIKMSYDKIEPEEPREDDGSERVFVVLR